MYTTEQELNFFVSEKGPFLVISLRGILSKATLPSLEDCSKKIAEKSAKHVILSLHDLTDIQMTAVPAFVKLQASIRAKPATLGLCFIASTVFGLLQDRGAVRKEEVYQTLEDALLSVGSK